MLVKHCNKTFKRLYARHPKISDYLPMQVMYRCFLLARTVLYYELAVIFAPAEVTVDPFELIKTQGALMFNSYCGPNGYSGQDL